MDSAGDGVAVVARRARGQEPAAIAAFRRAAGDAERAANIFMQIAEIAPDNAAAQGGLLRALVAAGHLAEAEAVLAELPEAMAKDAEIARARAALDLAKDRPADDELQPVTPAKAKRRTLRPGVTVPLCAPLCKGRGRVKTAETVCYEIFREILRVARAYENDVILVMAAQVVVDRLLDEESSAVADLEELTGKTVRFEVEPMYTQEQFDVVLF